MYTSSEQSVCRLVLIAFLAAAGLGLTGCGEDAPSSNIWSDALTVNEGPHHGVLSDPAVDARTKQNIHNTLANAIDDVLDRHPDGPEGLRQLLTDMRDNERRMAAGDVSGSAAEELREQHEQWWAAIEKRELPADYQ